LEEKMATLTVNAVVNGHRLFGLYSGEGETTVILDASLGCFRYLGRMGVRVQAYFTVIMLNLKRLVKLIIRVGFDVIA
jgi:hypothetical protein